ncbi:hypothetical protein OZ403_27830 [Myxococcus sp. NMCA1]|nr:hypothetical protein OZ403_27830 [Myxococcus sp. NMCA1]
MAEELAVCRATLYALLERGELERVCVGRPSRILIASLEARCGWGGAGGGARVGVPAEGPVLVAFSCKGRGGSPPVMRSVRM